MYDIMLDFPVASPTETTMKDIVTHKLTSYQEGDYCSYWFEEEQIVIMEQIINPNRNHYRTAEAFQNARKAWATIPTLSYISFPTNQQMVFRNLNSWSSGVATLATNVVSLTKTMTTDKGEWWKDKVWRRLESGKFQQIGTTPVNNIKIAHTHYANRIISVPLIKRFKDKDLKSMNIYVGETVIDLLSNFTLDIPREQFVFPYPHGVSFVRKDFTTYLYEENGRIFWNYFGKDGKFRVNAVDLEVITNNGRISQKSIKRFFKNQNKDLDNDLELFLHNYFEDAFEMKTEEVKPFHMGSGLISALMEFTYGFKIIANNSDSKGIDVVMDNENGGTPNIEECWDIITEDLLKIICLNDRDFAKEKLKKIAKGKAISSKTNPKRIGRRYFKWGEDDVQYVYPKSSKNGTKVRRHIRRGHTKKQPIKYPENYDGKAFQMGGAWYVSKTIAPYWAGGKSSIPENQISPFCFGAIKMKYAGGSRIASQWIRGIEKELGRKLHHNENGGKEYRVPYNNDKYFFLDAWDEETNTAYEFHGDYYHGNPNIYNAEDVNKTTKKTFGEMYNATLQKKTILEELGYHYVCIWESEFQSGS